MLPQPGSTPAGLPQIQKVAATIAKGLQISSSDRLSHPVLFPCGCCNKLFNNRNVLSQTWSPEVRNPSGPHTLRGLQGRVPSLPLPTPGGSAFPGLWPCHSTISLWLDCLLFSHLCLPFPVSNLFLPFSYYKWTLVIGLMAHLKHTRWSPHLNIFNLITSAKTLFPNKVTSTAFKDMDIPLERATHSALYTGHLWKKSKC